MPDPEHEKPLGYLLLEVFKLMRRRFEEAAKAHDLTLPQWRIMAEVKRGTVMTQASIAASTDIDAMTVSGVLDRLEKRGLVVRESAPNDSRAKQVRLSKDGEALYAKTSSMAQELNEEVMAGLDKAERTALARTLITIRTNLLDTPARPDRKDDQT